MEEEARMGLLVVVDIVILDGAVALGVEIDERPMQNWFVVVSS